MTIYLPPWLILFPLAWVGMGVLLWPILMVRVHRMMSHDVGWTWQTTLLGRRSKGFPNPLRILLGHAATVLLWPWALREVR